MKAIIVDDRRAPFYSDFEEPSGKDGLEVVKVCSAALTNLDVLIASGKHYLSPAHLPVVVGREAVAQTQSGSRFFLNVNAIPAPYGSMAEITLADLRYALPVPNDIEDDLAAALGNPGLAAWLPLSWRAGFQPGESVLILGATGTTGLMAVAAASALGAGRIIAAGRNAAALETARSLGAHTTVVLADDRNVLEQLLDEVQGKVDVVLDYLNGAPAEAALETMSLGGRMVQIGSKLAPGIVLNAQTGRKQLLDVLGFAYYHAPIEAQRSAYREICKLAANGIIKPNIEVLPLDCFPTAWAQQLAGTRKRMVLIPWEGGAEPAQADTGEP